MYNKGTYSKGNKYYIIHICDKQHKVKKPMWDKYYKVTNTVG